MKSIFDFQQKKNNKEKISMITCYDFTSAGILAKTTIDGLLVGDSVAMTMHGHKNTLAATLEMMCLHTKAVARGANEKFIVSDMPFLSYRASLSQSVKAASMLMQSGAHALKLEGASGNEKLIHHFVRSGIPIMGHLGLTPQLVHMLGGFKVQGKTTESALQLQKDALCLQDAGCFALVLECVPSTLAKEITNSLQIPVIGIGAGSHTDGQILVWQDLLGLNPEKPAKFVKQFLAGGELLTDAIQLYIQEIHTGAYPTNAHCYGS